MKKEKERILRDFSLALDEMRHGWHVQDDPVFEDIYEAYQELRIGSENAFLVGWEVVDSDTSNLYVTHKASGRRYRISVVYPAALYVDVYRILGDGAEVSAFNS